MFHDSPDNRNFLFFLNEVHPLGVEDSLIGALAALSSWEAVAAMVHTARKKDAFVRSIKGVRCIFMCLFVDGYVPFVIVLVLCCSGVGILTHISKA